MRLRKTNLCKRTYYQLLMLCQLAVLVFAFLNPPSVESKGATEYQIKAAYLFNFTRFFEWPNGAFVSENETFRICVLGDTPFGDELLHLEKRHYLEHPLRVNLSVSIDQARSCHLVYISSSEAQREDYILSKFRDAQTLLVSSSDNFAERGGVIGFVNVGNNIRFEVNRNAAQRAGLSPSAKLLEVAVRVIGNGRGNIE